jgi:hypothetical protein
MAGQALPGGQTTPPNINSLAAQGIQGAGMGAVAGMGYSPQQVGVAGSSASVNPTNVTAMGLSPTVTAGQLSNTQLAPYMNPYTTSVIDAQQADLLRGANIGLDQLGSQAQMAGSFGGSRHGIQGAELGRGVAELMGQQASGLRQANYQQAQRAAQQDIQANMQQQMANQAGGQFDIRTEMQRQLANQGAGMQGQLANQQAGMQDIGNQLQASLANQSAGLQGASQRLGASGQLGDVSNLGFNMGQTVNQNLQSQGAMQQALQQAVFDASAQKYGQYTGHPAQGLSYLNAALGVTPQGENTQVLSKQPGLFDYLTLGASGYTGGT